MHDHGDHRDARLNADERFPANLVWRCRAETEISETP
jgi:hypothetical protein